MLKLLIILMAMWGCAKKPPVIIEEPVITVEVIEEVEPEVKVFEDLVHEPVILPTIYFDFDVSQLREDQLDKMDILFNLKGERVCVIQGHACEIGTYSYNQDLGEKRAQSVYDWLVSRGDSSSRLTIVSYGETMPATTEEHLFHVNRRVEVKCE